MHDRTADKIARVTSRITGCAATIVPFDSTARVSDPAEYAGQRGYTPPGSPARNGEPGDDHAETDNGDSAQIAAISGRGRRVVTGRVHAIRIRPVGQSFILACTVTDDSGELTAMFYGRRHIPGIEPGTRLRLRGQVSVGSAGPIMANPAYEITDSEP
jgi:hypothetical protein